MSLKAPWAILLCRCNDDPNDPTTTTISTLYSQWNAVHDAVWMTDNIDAGAQFDGRTIADLYYLLFTTAGIFTWNVVRYFDEVSHGRVDVTGNQVFICNIDLTRDEARDKSSDHVDMFQRAKAALKDQHNIDWRDFPGGVAVSFQCDIGGAQGYEEIDGGPGVFSDIRYVRNNGSTSWGHEMLHGFGLGHSRTNLQLTSACSGGDPSDYTDDWDIMSAVGCALWSQDPNYGSMGPGLNAWNMRYLGWLDETRIWQGPPSGDFSIRITIGPLHHHRNSQVLLGARLPGIGADSDYLVEFRVPEFWDAMFGSPLVMVHRFNKPNSYVMRGTSGQKTLRAGDIFEVGTGPISRLKVEAIDPIAKIATIHLCYHQSAPQPPSVKVVSDAPPVRFGAARRESICRSNLIGGSYAWFGFELKAECAPDFTVTWIVTGGAIGSQVNQDRFVQVLLPQVGQEVSITVKILFNDGNSIFDTYRFTAISQETAEWQEFICRLLQDDRKLPTPWWRWGPEQIASLIPKLTTKARKDLLVRSETMLVALRKAIEKGR